MKNTSKIDDNNTNGDTKSLGDRPSNNLIVKSSSTELNICDVCEKSESRGGGVVVECSCQVRSSQNSTRVELTDESRKKRCVDRYDSSESSDSGVVLLSSTDSGTCSGSDITEPRSPYSPSSSSSTSEDSLAARMPAWACEPATTSPRSASTPESPKTANCIASPQHRKRQNLEALIAARLHPERVAPPVAPSAPAQRRLALPRTVHDGSKSQGRMTEYYNQMKPQNGLKRDSSMGRNEEPKKKCPSKGAAEDLKKYMSLLSQTLSPEVLIDNGKSVEVSNDKSFNTTVNGVSDKKIGINTSFMTNGLTLQRHVPNKINSAVNNNNIQLDSRMNGVTCGSNNILLSNVAGKSSPRKEITRKAAVSKRQNRRNIATAGNNQNLTWAKLESNWAKANSLKQTQNIKAATGSVGKKDIPEKCISNIQESIPKVSLPQTPISVPNGVRQISINGNMNNTHMNNLSLPNNQNYNHLNITQSYNGAVTTSTNLGSFVAMPQTVMLTTLRIPQNSSQAQNMNAQNNLNAFSRQNMTIGSPTKLNGQFVFPFVQNINGTVVQIPNIMTKVASNFVIPHSTQIPTQRHDNNIQAQAQQQAAQMLLNGTLVKLANATSYTVTRPTTTTNISFPVVNKNVNTGMPTVLAPKPNYTMNVGHTMFNVPQPGFFINTVPNVTSKDNVAFVSTANSVSTPMHHTGVTTSTTPVLYTSAHMNINMPTESLLHSSSIPPKAQVEPPDKMGKPLDRNINSSERTVTEQNPIVQNSNSVSSIVSNNPRIAEILSRPFAQVCNLSHTLKDMLPVHKDQAKRRKFSDNLNKIDDSNSESSIESTKFEEITPVDREETLFTQITVRKDVSSEVQNTIMESTFSNSTSESSESGIGTDKSIDSPSDSRTSKDCDDDSSLSLSVSICSNEETVVPQKSPILKQPKTLRFPLKKFEPKAINKQRSGRVSTQSSVTVCLWENCKKEFDTDTDLMEHLQTTHVDGQAEKPTKVCLWENCKVRGKPSCSRHWLERHTLSHGGNKPFKCIVDGCDRRFSTQLLLERHVNHHFNEQSNSVKNANKTTDAGPKLIRRNGKKLRYRRQPWSARMFDFFDPGMMEGLAWRLTRSTQWRLCGGCPFKDTGRHTLSVVSAITATRYNAAKAIKEVLVTYYPTNVLEDEWIPEQEVQKVRKLEISELPTHTKVMLYDQFCSSYRTNNALYQDDTANEKPSTSTVSTVTEIELEEKTIIKVEATELESSRIIKVEASEPESSKMLNNLIPRNKTSDLLGECDGYSVLELPNPKCIEVKKEVSGARKRKLGRRQGGNAFWPCGR